MSWHIVFGLQSTGNIFPWSMLCWSIIVKQVWWRKGSTGWKPADFMFPISVWFRSALFNVFLFATLIDSINHINVYTIPVRILQVWLKIIKDVEKNSTENGLTLLNASDFPFHIKFHCYERKKMKNLDKCGNSY